MFNEPGFVKNVREHARGIEPLQEFGVAVLGLVLLLVYMTGTSRGLFPYFAIGTLAFLSLTLILAVFFYIKDRMVRGTPATTLGAATVLFFLATLFTYASGYGIDPSQFTTAVSDISHAIQNPLGFIDIIKSWVA
jgi:hypothetical protein